MSDADFRLALSRLRAARTHLVTACEMVPTSRDVKAFRDVVLTNMANAEAYLASLRAVVAGEASRRAKLRRKTKR